MIKYFKYTKYLLFVILIIFTFAFQHSVPVLLFELCELIEVLIVSNILVSKNRAVGRIVNTVLCLLLGIQILVHLFSLEYLSLVMLSNITLIEDLSGKAYVYIPVVLLVVTASVLPIDCFQRICKHNTSILSTALALELVFTLILGNTFSPFYNLALMLKKYNERQEFVSRIDSADNITNLFYSAQVADYRSKPEGLQDSPNVVLIFVEGFSQSIVDDSRGLMPNVEYWENNSLNFTGYYNHTFATYRGLSGQLFSGYSYEDRDVNSLVSLPQIFSDIGYSTTFINSEPYNIQFEEYLERLGFDSVIADTGSYSGPWNSLSDREALDLLFETISNQSDSNEPFFTAMYTYGTHVTLDSPDLTYGDGNNAVLNKFYNFDYWFGEFMERFNESPLADNTILIFTADHATYEDLDFSQTFPDYERLFSEADEIPFFIYYNGIEPEEIDVAGRNSLSLAPTILDYLDISAPNYFLGFSLFMSAVNSNNYDTIFSDGLNSNIISTEGGNIRSLYENEYAVVSENLTNYYIASSQSPIALYH